MIHKLLLAATVVLGASGAAVAADPVMIVTYDPEIMASDWTGFYAGAWLGGRISTIDNTACVGICADDFGLNGVTGGVTAGYDYQVNDTLVVGAFATLPLIRPTTTAEIVAFNATFDVVPQFALIAGGRVGLAQGNFMPYALAGFGIANVEVTPSFPGTSASSATHIGGVVGAGVEYKVNDSWSIDARYMFGALGEAEYDFCGSAGCRSSYTEVSHNFSIGLNYRF